MGDQFSMVVLNLGNLGEDTSDGGEDAASNAVDVADETGDIADNGAGGCADDTVGELENGSKKGRDEFENGLDLGLDGRVNICCVVSLV